MKTIIKPVVFFTLGFLFYFYSLFGSPLFQIEEYKIPPVETDTVFIDDDYNSSTLGWGIYCFDTIQHGIAAIDVGGVVYVYEGTYYENLIINKKIQLIGEDKDSTIIDGQNLNNVIIISSDSVSISGFNIINGLDYGIKVNSNANLVFGNNFSSHEERAIYLYMVENNSITENNFNSNSGGIRLNQSSHNFIENNVFYHGSIFFDLNCNYNQISANIMQNSSGLLL